MKKFIEDKLVKLNQENRQLNNEWAVGGVSLSPTDEKKLIRKIDRVVGEIKACNYILTELEREIAEKIQTVEFNNLGTLSGCMADSCNKGKISALESLLDENIKL